MRPRWPLLLRASDSTGWKCSTRWMKALPCPSVPRWEPTFMPRPPCKRWLSCSPVTGCPRRCASTAMCALLAVLQAATSRRQRSRFCQCVGVGVLVCDPHSPQQNGFVERYHRTFQEECLAVQRPGTLEEVREATAQVQQHYNWSRPHQGLSCSNRPPRVAFATLPDLPAVPDLVDPDRWLRVNDGLHLVRLVRRDGTVRVDLKSYYVGRALAGQHVALHLSAAKAALLVVHGQQVIKTLPLKGLGGKALRFEAFVQPMMGQARAEHRLRNAQERRARLGGEASP